MKNVVILGSTGSIGTQTLNVVRRFPDKFKVVGLVAYKNFELLQKQAEEFMPPYVGIVNEDAYKSLNLSYKCNIACGEKVLTDFPSLPECDIVVCAVVGMSGFDGVLSAIKNKKEVALANKEVLVAGGEFVTAYARKQGVKILPVDSEHSAVWQCLEGKKMKDISKIILTASGGPFRGVTDVKLLENVTVEQAVAHPNWNMGKKISVDSATMMNKGLEIIEARWLFDFTDIDYIIHPQSVIHSMIKCVDGSVIAQISKPDMELPIQLALGYPDRLSSTQFDFPFDKDLTFIQPNEKVFPLPALAKESLKMGGCAPCVLNSANEVAVSLFLNRKIKFTDIARIVENALNKITVNKFNTYDDIVGTHEMTQQKILSNYLDYLER